MNNYTIAIALICLTGFSGLRPADSTNRSTTTGDADIKVSGTSNLHDWTMEAKNSSCSASFNFLPGNANQPQSLTALTLSVPVQNLKSGKSSMDSKAYTALKAKTYSTIVFVLTSATILPGQKNQFEVKSTGNLSIAGVTKQVTMDVTGIVNTDGTITCHGSKKLKMTDYQIKPPVFMLGTLKTGDDLTIDFILIVTHASHV
jgi:polyisoprenoid-binding protein YceI